MKMHDPTTCQNSETCKECGSGLVWNRCNFAHYQKEAFPPKYYGLCFLCAIWLQIIDEFNPGTVIVDHGPVLLGFALQTSGLQSYHFNPDMPIVDRHGDPWLLGFSGRLWKITFFDGRIVQTNNLWHGGEVPERFQDRLKPNAVLKALLKTDFGRLLGEGSSGDVS